MLFRTRSQAPRQNTNAMLRRRLLRTACYRKRPPPPFRTKRTETYTRFQSGSKTSRDNYAPVANTRRTRRQAGLSRAATLSIAASPATFRYPYENKKNDFAFPPSSRHCSLATRPPSRVRESTRPAPQFHHNVVEVRNIVCNSQRKTRSFAKKNKEKTRLKFARWT